MLALLEVGDGQEIHHHGCLFVIEAAQEVIFLDGFHNQVCLTGVGRSAGRLVITPGPIMHHQQ